MRDDRSKWPPAPADFSRLESDAVVVTHSNVGRQYLISGPSVVQDMKGEIGWPDVAQTGEYVLRTRRDQTLHVGGPAQETGWIGTRGLAISDMTAGYCVFSLSGTGAFALLSRGAELDLARPSRSVARYMWGMNTILYRHKVSDSYRLHVERGLAPALYQIFVHQIHFSD